jgi:hypothetical protein
MQLAVAQHAALHAVQATDHTNTFSFGSYLANTQSWVGGHVGLQLLAAHWPALMS